MKGELVDRAKAVAQVFLRPSSGGDLRARPVRGAPLAAHGGSIGEDDGAG
jgi:hypothetical protein